MFGTLASALRARQVEFDQSQFTADVEGAIEGPNNQTIRITSVHVHYHLRVPAAQRTTADRALQVHPAGCPAHESVKGSIEITWSADVEEF
ncbi:MAG: OsmC family protein [Dehalococcoidia bacterium]